MGLVRKAKTDSVAVDAGGSVDISTLIRQAVTDEIERQRLEKLEADGDRDDSVAAGPADGKHDGRRAE